MSENNRKERWFIYLHECKIEFSAYQGGQAKAKGGANALLPLNPPPRKNPESVYSKLAYYQELLKVVDKGLEKDE